MTTDQVAAALLSYAAFDRVPPKAVVDAAKAPNLPDDDLMALFRRRLADRDPILSLPAALRDRVLDARRGLADRTRPSRVLLDAVSY